MQKHVSKEKILKAFEENNLAHVPRFIKKLVAQIKKETFDKSKSLAQVKGEVALELTRLSEELSSEHAIFLFRQAIQQVPRNILLYSGLISAYLLANDITEADRWWEIATKIESRSGDIWLLGVTLALKQNDAEKAELLLEHAIKLLSEDDEGVRRAAAQINLWKGEQAQLKGELDRAIFWIRRAMLDDENWGKPQECLNHILGNMRRFGSPARFSKTDSMDSSQSPTVVPIRGKVPCLTD